jgi:hypothetical protein
MAGEGGGVRGRGGGRGQEGQRSVDGETVSDLATAHTRTSNTCYAANGLSILSLPEVRVCEQDVSEYSEDKVAAKILEAKRVQGVGGGGGDGVSSRTSRREHHVTWASECASSRCPRRIYMSSHYYNMSICVLILGEEQ